MSSARCVSCVSLLAALSALSCAPVIHGRRDVGSTDPKPLATPVMYECVSMRFFLVEGASPLEVRATQAPTCTPRTMDPYVMNYSVRRDDGDHFFVWNEDDGFANELVVPLDRRRDAELRQFSSEGASRSHRLIKGERGLESIEGTPTHRWPCWSHAPGADALRASAEAP